MFSTSPIPRLGARPARGSAGMLAKEGIVWGNAAWQARFAKIDGEVSSLQSASEDTLAKWKKTPPPKETSIAFGAWQSEFFAFIKEWGAFKNDGPWATDSNDAMLQTFELRIAALRKRYDKLASVSLPAVDPPVPYAPPDPKKSTDPLDVVKWVGIGVLGVLGIVAVRSIAG